jgi:hypothetical protein
MLVIALMEEAATAEEVVVDTVVGAVEDTVEVEEEVEAVAATSMYYELER